MTIEERLNRIEKKLNLDEIDQPRPEPGTVVIRDDGVAGLVTGRGTVSFAADEVMWWADCGPEWKPANLLADDEVAVEKNELANLRYFVNNPSAWDDGFSQNVSDAIERLITRPEAERLENGR